MRPVTFILLAALASRAATASAQQSLSDAVLYGSMASVDALIAGGADVNAPDDTGLTPLMVASAQGSPAMVRRLIAAGADVKAVAQDGTTALMRAASANRGEALRVLMASGADIDQRSAAGMSALTFAAFSGNAELVAALLAGHADPNLKDNQGRTPLMAAVTNGDPAIVEALLNAGASVDAADAGGGVAMTYAAAGGSADAIRALRKRGATLRDLDVKLAASECHPDAVRVLLEGGLKADGAGGTGNTDAPLLVATVASCPDVVTVLLDHHANVNATDADGRTPLIVACAANMVDVARILLAHGADLSIEDKLGRTAQMYAGTNGHEEIATLLKEPAFGLAVGIQGSPARIVVESSALKADQPIPRDYTADGHNWSPPLSWTGVPAAARQLAVVCEDPDAGNPPPFAHWVIYRIPATARSLPQNIPFEPGATMPAELTGAIQGLSGFRRPFYRGPAPPPGKPHHYHFVVYALDAVALKDGLTRAELLDAIKGHVLAQGDLVATYERKP